MYSTLFPRLKGAYLIRVVPSLLYLFSCIIVYVCNAQYGICTRVDVLCNTVCLILYYSINLQYIKFKYLQRKERNNSIKRYSCNTSFTVTNWPVLQIPLFRNEQQIDNTKLFVSLTRSWHLECKKKLTLTLSTISWLWKCLYFYFLLTDPVCNLSSEKKHY